MGFSAYVTALTGFSRLIGSQKTNTETSGSLTVMGLDFQHASVVTRFSRLIGSQKPDTEMSEILTAICFSAYVTVLTVFSRLIGSPKKRILKRQGA
jgi:hypothetical protein